MRVVGHYSADEAQVAFRAGRRMRQQLILLVVGFGLTGGLGSLIGFILQSRTWSHQHKVGRRDEERAEAQKTCDEISRLMDRRLYRMRRLYWSCRREVLSTAQDAGISSALEDYREVVAEWNDNLNRTLAIAEASFGSEFRAVVADQIYEEFAAAGRGLEEITKIAMKMGSKNVELPVFGYRMTRLSRCVYEVNSQMLSMLREEAIGRDAVRHSPGTVVSGKARVTLEIGDQGEAVRALQRGLRRAGRVPQIDGYFLLGTWAAVCDFQRSRGLPSDGIVGSQTWAELPNAAPMPLLRLGSSGGVVADLQRVLAQGAGGRWETMPAEITGTFDGSTSAAVEAFQRWNGIAFDGLVGDQTWAASAGKSSLEDAVGLKYLVAAKP